MATSTIKQQNVIQVEELSITITVGNNRGSVVITDLSYNPQDYVWSASICATDTSNAYSGCFVEFLIPYNNKIMVSINRTLRNDTSSAIEVNAILIGIHK